MRACIAIAGWAETHPASVPGTLRRSEKWPDVKDFFSIQLTKRDNLTILYMFPGAMTVR